MFELYVEFIRGVSRFYSHLTNKSFAGLRSPVILCNKSFKRRRYLFLVPAAREMYHKN